MATLSQRPHLEPFTVDASTTVGCVTLAVADLAAMTRFYHEAIGLAVLDESAGAVTLGVGEQRVVRLWARPNGRQPARATGLFHLAILVPSRADLGHWLQHYVRTVGRMIDGAGEHLVSEALYLTDPEGNGIEIYRDRPRDAWEFVDGQLRMETLAVDLPAVAAAAPDEPFTGLRAGSRIGHVHLKVSEIPATDWFYQDVLGFTFMVRYPGASFLSAGGYHHHIGANIWHSRGAPPPPADALGLLEYEIIYPSEAERDEVLQRVSAADMPLGERDGDPLVRDPSGNAARLTLA